VRVSEGGLYTTVWYLDAWDEVIGKVSGVTFADGTVETHETADHGPRGGGRGHRGALHCGPWEQIFYGEFDGRRPKRVLVKIMSE